MRYAELTEGDKLPLVVQNPKYDDEPLTVEVFRDPERGRIAALTRKVYCRAYIVDQSVFAWRAESAALHEDVLAKLLWRAR